MALDMLKAALDAFVNRDSAAARAIIPRDKEVDALNKEIHQVLAQHMVDNPDTIGRCLHWMVASKSLERIADHAKNIAEDVVLSLRGAGHPPHRREKPAHSRRRGLTGSSIAPSEDKWPPPARSVRGFPPPKRLTFGRRPPGIPPGQWPGPGGDAGWRPPR